MSERYCGLLPGIESTRSKAAFPDPVFVLAPELQGHDLSQAPRTVKSPNRAITAQERVLAHLASA
jgi:hypothetical protein